MLMQILEKVRPRVVNDLRLFAAGTHAHTKAIESLGYGTSDTTSRSTARSGDSCS